MNFDHIKYFLVSLLVSKLITDNLPSFHRKDLKIYWNVTVSWTSVIYNLIRFFIAVSTIILGLAGLMWVWKKSKIQDTSGIVPILIAFIIAGLGIELFKRTIAPSMQLEKANRTYQK